MVVLLGGYGLTSLQFWSYMLCYVFAWTPYKSLGWEAVHDRQWYETSSHLLLTDNWHQFLWCWDTGLGMIVGQMLKCKWWVHGGQMCTICYLCVMFTSCQSNSRHQSVCLPKLGNTSALGVCPTIHWDSSSTQCINQDVGACCETMHCHIMLWL